MSWIFRALRTLLRRIRRPAVSEYEKYEEMREFGPVIHQGGSMYVIGYQEAKLILGDSKRFVKDINNTLPLEQRPLHADQSTDMFSLLYNNMLAKDGADHTRLRRLVSRAFTKRQIDSLTPRIQQIADELIDDFQADGEADLIDVFAFPLPIIVICELLGVPIEDRNKFKDWSHAFLGIADDEFSYFQLLTEFVQYIGRMIALRRAEPKDDLISALVHAEEEGEQLTEQELYSMIALLIVAGHETTVNLIGNGMAALLQNREQLELLQKQPELIENAVEEFLRYEGPVEFTTTRYAAEDVQVGDTLIKRRTPVTIILAAANRDPAAFENPIKLDVTRDAQQHLGFSYGVHFCVGAPLARLEAKIAFSTLLSRLPNIQLRAPHRQLVYNEGSIVHGLKALPVTW
ncbi:MAG: cytochrome P450 [Chloroflexota bacterium]